jgi:hypothetical protein
MREVTVALSSVYDEARDSRFMDLGGQAESPRSALEIGATLGSDFDRLDDAFSGTLHLSINCQIDVTFFPEVCH